MNLQELLKEPESEFLDYKRCFHENKAKLLHDILCLSNAYADGDRYLVFGVEDDGQIFGIDSDPNRRNNAQIQDFIRQVGFNRMPTLRLSEETSGSKAIAVLTISNRPDKPFFLTKEYRDKDVLVPAGAIYTRLGNTNVPLKELTPENYVELMWRERFGIGKPPLERFLLMLDDPAKWVKFDGGDYQYYRDFPEFTIRVGERIQDGFKEPWTVHFPDGSAHSYYLEVQYLGTLLHRYMFVSCDGGRYQVPLPIREGEKFFLLADSPEVKLAHLYFQYLSLETALEMAGVELR